MLKAKALQAGQRQQGRIDLAFVELAQTRLHIAAKHRDAKIGPQPLYQRLPPQRG